MGAIQLHTDIQFIKGIGPKRSALLAGVGMHTAEDLLRHYPRRYLDRSRQAPLGSLQDDDDVTVVGTVVSCGIRKGRRDRFTLMLSDGSGTIDCVWFQGVSYIRKVFTPGQTVAFSGRIKRYRGGLQLVHPEYDLISDESDGDQIHTGGIIPMYSSTEKLSRAGLDSRGFRRVMQPFLKQIIPEVTDPLPETQRRALGLQPLADALAAIHFPSDWEACARARERLVFDELFFIQLSLARERKRREQELTGHRFTADGMLHRRFLDGLPFSLTGAQRRAVEDIQRDTSSGRPMNRMLQGDVGSGKTLVAVMAMLAAVESGYQAALMAPTEILAEQHYLTLQRMLGGLDLRIVLLKGGTAARDKQESLTAIESGAADIAVGTHALVQQSVTFDRLALVIIDEQHRFGVMQRAVLRRKGVTTHALVMTATPIPRTLALTLYGDLDVSILDERPPGRLPVRTAWRKDEARERVYEFIRSEAAAGRQAYIVYPLVEESEKLDLADATAGYELLSSSVFPEFRVALLHGRLSADEKDRIMADFKSGTTRILVSTTVIEVGVDVPNATVMLVEHAERFGLPQLHQLRGRIGRGPQRSTCILMTPSYITETALSRIETMVNTDDGFKIAEKDLEIRGPGELFGTRQHGDLGLKLASLATDGPVIERARNTAHDIISADALLEKGEHRPLKDALERWSAHGRGGLLKIG
ncbi:ATP-dependent DNA helicase RecG [bacterium]|nr:ATP-dependent DNA helicase RecG [bacterium]